MTTIDDAWPESAREYRNDRERNERARGHGHFEAKESIEDLVDRLARMPAYAYDIVRETHALEIGCRIPTLDKTVAKRRKQLSNEDDKQGQAIQFPQPEPWPDAVDGAELLNALSAAIRRHVVLPEHSADAAALWVLHTYLLDVLLISPRLAIASPEKGCGKTTLLDVLSKLVLRPLEMANTSVSPVFRAIEMARPCLLIDEADTFLRDNDELRGVLNSGHRRGSAVLRNVGDDYEPRLFSTYSACAVAMIGKPPGTLADRSVVIEMRRRHAGEPVESFRFDRTAHLEALACKAARWTADSAERVREADPDMPAGVFNRVADNWRPLLAIADTAGDEWPKRARESLAVIQATVEDESQNTQLLADIRDIFDERGVDRVVSAELVEALVAMEGRPWAEYSKTGKALSQNALARLLKKFKTGDNAPIVPTDVWTGERNLKGYLLSQLEDAFERYLAHLPLHNRATARRLQPSALLAL